MPQFLHTVLAGFTTASLFIFAISAYHLAKQNDKEVFYASFKISTIIGLVAIIGLGGIGHAQALGIMKTNPMKMIAAEAMWNTEDPASMSLFTIADQDEGKNIVDIRVPAGLSMLLYLRPTGEVQGINQLQEEYQAKYGFGNYIPPINITNYTFRIMVGLGMIMALLLLYSVYQVLRKKPPEKMWLFRFFPLAIFMPYLSNSSGWILTEMGRQPWVVFGLLKTVDGVSSHNISTILISLIGFAIVYSGLLIADVYLLVKFAKAGVQESNIDENYIESQLGA